MYCDKGTTTSDVIRQLLWITCLQRCDKQICDIFGWRLARPDWTHPSMGKTIFFYSAALFVAFPFLAVTMNTIMTILTFIQGKGHIIARGCPCLTQSHKSRIQERVSQKEFLKESEGNPITRYSVWKILKRASLLHQG